MATDAQPRAGCGDLSHKEISREQENLQTNLHSLSLAKQPRYVNKFTAHRNCCPSKHFQKIKDCLEVYQTPLSTPVKTPKRKAKPKAASLEDLTPVKMFRADNKEFASEQKPSQGRKRIMMAEPMVRNVEIQNVRRCIDHVCRVLDSQKVSMGIKAVSMEELTPHERAVGHESEGRAQLTRVQRRAGRALLAALALRAWRRQSLRCNEVSRNLEAQTQHGERQRRQLVALRSLVGADEGRARAALCEAARHRRAARSLHALCATQQQELQELQEEMAACVRSAAEARAALEGQASAARGEAEAARGEVEAARTETAAAREEARTARGEADAARARSAADALACARMHAERSQLAKQADKRTATAAATKAQASASGLQRELGQLRLALAQAKEAVACEKLCREELEAQSSEAEARACAAELRVRLLTTQLEDARRWWLSKPLLRLMKYTQQNISREMLWKATLWHLLAFRNTSI